MGDLGISSGHRVQQVDGRTVIYAPNGLIFHDFGRLVEPEVYEEVIRAWNAGFKSGMALGEMKGRTEVQTAVKSALGLAEGPDHAG